MRERILRIGPDRVPGGGLGLVKRPALEPANRQPGMQVRGVRLDGERLRHFLLGVGIPPQLEQHASALSADVRREVVEAAIAAAQQVIAQSVGPADQQKLADGFRERIQAIAARAPRTSRPVAGGPS